MMSAMKASSDGFNSRLYRSGVEPIPVVYVSVPEENIDDLVLAKLLAKNRATLDFN